MPKSYCLATVTRVLRTAGNRDSTACAKLDRCDMNQYESEAVQYRSSTPPKCSLGGVFLCAGSDEVTWESWREGGVRPIRVPGHKS